MKCLFFLGTSHATKSDKFSERFQTAVDPHPPPLRLVPIVGNHEHAFHTIGPPCIYASISIIKNLHYNFLKIGGGVEGHLEFSGKFILFGSAILPIVQQRFKKSDAS